MSPRDLDRAVPTWRLKASAAGNLQCKGTTMEPVRPVSSRDTPGSAAVRSGRVRYCIVPAGLAPRLGESLRLWFVDDLDVEVVLDRRRVRRARGLGAREPLVLPAAARLYRRELVMALLPSYDERDAPASLLARVADGQRTAFDELYLRYRLPFYTRLRSALRDDHEAEDLTHAVLLKVEKALRGGGYRGQPLKRWLLAVERNALRDHLRKHRRIVVCDPQEVARRRESEGGVRDAPVVHWLSEARLREQFDRLGEREQHVLMLSFVGGLTPAEIALALGSTSNSVSSSKSQAIKRLRRQLHYEPESPGRSRARAY